MTFARRERCWSRYGSVDNAEKAAGAVLYSACLSDSPALSASSTARSRAGRSPPAPTTTELEHVTEDLLVEDVSIDGMCGVY